MGKVDILIVAETKIDASISRAQFSNVGYYKPFRVDVSEVSRCIQSECGKIRTRKCPNTDTFYAVLVSINSSIRTKQLHSNNLNLSIQAPSQDLPGPSCRNTRTRCEICSKLTIKTQYLHILASFWRLYC